MLLILLVLFSTGNVDVGFRNEESLILRMDNSVVQFGIVDPVTKKAEVPAAIVMTVFSNTDWMLSCKPEGDFISDEGEEIPIERLYYRVNGGIYKKMESDGEVIEKGGPTQDTGERIIMDMRLQLSWEDPAGNYKAKLVFTVTNIN